MGYVIGIALGLLAAGGLVFFFLRKRRQPVVVPEEPLPPTMVELLAANVPYYASLPENRQAVFAERVNLFLANVTIEGVDTEVTDVDKVLVASSAVIPVFAFDDWTYPNLTNVVLYESTFNEKFETDETDRRTMGLVGMGGALQSSMVLSKSALLNGFLNKTSKENTGIHEFVHLLDKVDGEIDGSPEMMVPQEHLQPWLRLMHETMQQMETGRTDINSYGLTNEAEFFAVVSEYFFKRPDLLKQKHPELFEQLELIFRQNPATEGKVLEEGEGDNELGSTQ